jgi:integrase
MRMPATTDIERRDRALIAFTILTGARDGAIASLKVKHVDIVARRLDQDAREVKTKFSKTFSTWFFPIGGEALAILEDWVAHLRGALLWGNDDPLFPATLRGQSDAGGFIPAGLGRKHWSTADPIRRIFAKAFKDAGLESFNPHSFRDTLVRLGEQRCQTPEEFKAWSQNLGHEKVLTTFTSYGIVASKRQAEIIQGLGNQPASDPVAALEARLSRLEAANSSQ